MDEATGGFSIAREDLLDLKFPMKLWLLVNTPNNAIRWCDDGESFTVHFLALDNYLCSPASLFKINSKSVFISYLTAYGFQSMAADGCNSTEKGVICKFKHEHFRKGCSDLIEKIVKGSGAPVSQRHDLGLVGVQQRTFQPPNRQYDPCHGLIRSLSNIERARLNLRLILQVQNESLMLQEKLSEEDNDSQTDLVSIIELPADTYVNPMASISRFEENPEIAGFYGNVSTEVIKTFFDAYLPLYASIDDITVEPEGESTSQVEGTVEETVEGTVETAIATPSMASVKSAEPEPQNQNPSNFQIKYSVILDSNESKEYTLDLLDEFSEEMTTVGGQLGASMHSEIESYYENPNTLQPIYQNDDEDAAGGNKEDDISMDDYLKFNNSGQQNGGNVENASEDVEMEEELKTDTGLPNIDESNDDENFRDFFHQYRETINFLQVEGTVEETVEGTVETAIATPSMASVKSAEPEPQNQNHQNQPSYPSNFQIKYSVILDSNESNEYTLDLLVEFSDEMMTVGGQLGARMHSEIESYYENPNTLQPIYQNDDEDAAGGNKEDDFSMDDYLKFNNSGQQNGGNVENASEDAEMEEELKTDTELPNIDESNDDENFRDFFHQYRETINFLYD